MIVTFAATLPPASSSLTALTNPTMASPSFEAIVAAMPAGVPPTGGESAAAQSGDAPRADDSLVPSPADDPADALDSITDLVAALDGMPTPDIRSPAMPATPPEPPRVAPAISVEGSSGLPAPRRSPNPVLEQAPGPHFDRVERPIAGLAVDTPSPIASLAAAALAQPSEPAVKPDAIIPKTLDFSAGDAWIDSLARDIAATAAPGGRLRFALVPEHLGRLDVQMTCSDRAIDVHLAARGEGARDMLSAAQPRIVEEIRAQGIRIAAVEISAELPSQGDPGRGTRAAPVLLVETADAVAKPALIAAPRSAHPGRYA